MAQYIAEATVKTSIEVTSEAAGKSRDELDSAVLRFVDHYLDRFDKATLTIPEICVVGAKTIEAKVRHSVELPDGLAAQELFSAADAAITAVAEVPCTVTAMWLLGPEINRPV